MDHWIDYFIEDVHNVTRWIIKLLLSMLNLFFKVQVVEVVKRNHIRPNWLGSLDFLHAKPRWEECERGRKEKKR